MTSTAEQSRTVADLMTRELIVLRPDNRIGRARDYIVSLGIHAIPIMVDGEVVGIVTSTDLVDDWADDELVSTVMSASPQTIDAEAAVRDAADMMIERHIHHLLVETEGEVVGILSSLDLLHDLVVVQQ